MDEIDYTAEQRAEIEAFELEFERQLQRVGVDLQEAMLQLHHPIPPVERFISDDETELTLSIDISGIMHTLRSLPDGAGSAAFVAAYNQPRHPTPVDSPA
ncbi:MAG TPA: hypothetical protein VE869_06770 [Gemmatimonas sp.]|nr:hypothetical protein [Gemmatimonas sp.]